MPEIQEINLVQAPRLICTIVFVDFKLSLIVLQNENVTHETKHSCTPDFSKNEVDEQIYGCKQAITDGYYPPVPQTYNNMVAKFENSGLDLLCKVPNFASIKSSY